MGKKTCTLHTARITKRITISSIFITTLSTIFQHCTWILDEGRFDDWMSLIYDGKSVYKIECGSSKSGLLIIMTPSTIYDLMKNIEKFTVNLLKNFVVAVVWIHCFRLSAFLFFCNISFSCWNCAIYEIDKGMAPSRTRLNRILWILLSKCIHAYWCQRSNFAAEKEIAVVDKFEIKLYGNWTNRSFAL